MNTIILKGRLTSNLELKSTSNGKTYTIFCIAVDRAFQKDKENKETDFINCKAWGKTAEFLGKYFCKGKEVLLTGELHNDNYEDKDGNKKTFSYVNVNQVEFVGGKATAEETKTENVGFEDDDVLPF